MPYKPTGRPPGRPRKQLHSDRPPDLTENQWSALNAELTGIDLTRLPAWPSRTSLRKVAAHAGVSHQAVSKWRKEEAYVTGFWWLLDCVAERGRVRRPIRSPINYSRNKRQGDAHLDVYLHKHWTGPVVSPLDGKIYTDPVSYMRHIKESDALWIGDLPPSASEKEETEQ